MDNVESGIKRLVGSGDDASECPVRYHIADGIPASQAIAREFHGRRTHWWKTDGSPASSSRNLNAGKRPGGQTTFFSSETQAGTRLFLACISREGCSADYLFYGLLLVDSNCSAASSAIFAAVRFLRAKLRVSIFLPVVISPA